MKIGKDVKYYLLCEDKQEGRVFMSNADIYSIEFKPDIFAGPTTIFQGRLKGNIRIIDKPIESITDEEIINLIKEGEEL